MVLDYVFDVFNSLFVLPEMLNILSQGYHQICVALIGIKQSSLPHIVLCALDSVLFDVYSSVPPFLARLFPCNIFIM